MNLEDIIKDFENKETELRNLVNSFTQTFDDLLPNKDDADFFKKAYDDVLAGKNIDINEVTKRINNITDASRTTNK